MEEKKMITAQMVKDKAKEYGADLCGISPMSRFADPLSTQK